MNGRLPLAAKMEHVPPVIATGVDFVGTMLALHVATR